MVEEIRLAGSVLIGVTTVLAVACVVVHQLLARWWRTSSGRHVFTFEAVLALSLSLWSLRLVIPEGDWFQVVRLVAFAGMPFVLAWRIRIIVQTWRKGRRERTREVSDEVRET
ncbi:hypothetical protein [Streptosporangium sp. NPDC002721]|uniref:putative phage holin n=1 Tax=Streptosporangium sp. NPDC002721 TaxID=3366188 RepID=UPI0036BCD769